MAVNPNEIRQYQTYSDGSEQRHVAGSYVVYDKETGAVEQDDIYYWNVVDGKFGTVSIRMPKEEFARWAREEVK